MLSKTGSSSSRPLDSPSSMSASIRKLRIMNPAPAASIGPPIPSSCRIPWPHNVVSAMRSSRISSKASTFDMEASGRVIVR